MVMAKASIEILEALRNSARKIKDSLAYEWGHMGACNCGFLAQEVTKLTKAEIHRRALERHGDWTEHLNDYCPINGLPFDDVISELLAFGFDSDDLKHLEKLSDPTILRTIPFEARNLQHNNKHDVVTYLTAWIKLLEGELIDTIKIELPETEGALMEA
jgi:hypothetical protein